MCNWNEYNLNPLTKAIGGQVLVPAAAVIPAPIAYIKVVAVKTPVVGSADLGERSPDGLYCSPVLISPVRSRCSSLSV